MHSQSNELVNGHFLNTSFFFYSSVCYIFVSGMQEIASNGFLFSKIFRGGMPPDPPSRLAPSALTYGASYFTLIPLLLVILRRTLISIEATITAPVTFKVWHLIFKQVGRSCDQKIPTFDRVCEEWCRLETLGQQRCQI